MPVPIRWRPVLAAAVLAAGTWPLHAAAQAAEAPADKTPQNSAIDAPLFYQLLIGEMELRAGEAGTAFEVMLDAARRTRDELLFKRAVEIAVQARSGDQALMASRAWRHPRPQSQEAVRMQLHLLSATNKLADAAEPLRTLLTLTPEDERGALIATIPRYLQRATDRRQSAQLIDQVLQPYAEARSTRVAALVASGRAWATAEDGARALALARSAHEAEPAAPGPVLLALELMPRHAEAESLVTDHLSRPGADAAIRMAYARALTGMQRFVDAVAQLEIVTRERPDVASGHLTLGALQLELRHPREAEAALKRYLELVPAEAAKAAAAPAADADADDESDSRTDQGVVQAWMMLAQAAELRKDFAAAEAWLARIDDPKRALEVQARRATLLARQGKVTEAREAVRRVPEREAGDVRAKLLAEAGVLREVRQWSEAYQVLEQANQRFTDDADLLYEQAMVAEKMERLDQMERLLRRVIEIKPDNAHAHNALGYSLADRSQRLPEAQQLIRRALELSPGDPFITDSLGWVEFRLGNSDEALRLLRQAYSARPDVEIAAHLGEVLWARGARDEARRVWREAQGRDAANDVLVETLARLKADL